MKIKTQFFTKTFTLILLFITLIPLIILGLYNHPHYHDDYLTFSSFQNGKNAITNLTIHGRYTAAFNWLFFPRPHNPVTVFDMEKITHFYHIMSILYIFLFALSFCFFLFTINKYLLHLTHKYFILLYSLSLFFLINQLANINYFFYYIIYAGGYTLGFCLLLIFIANIIEYIFTKKNSLKLITTLVLLNGCLEFYPILAGFIIFITIVMKIIKNKKIDFLLVTLLLISFLNFILYITNPFNDTKIQMYNDGTSGTLISKLTNSYFYTIQALINLNTTFFTFNTFPFILVISLIIGVAFRKKIKKIFFFLTLIPIFMILIITTAMAYSNMLNVTYFPHTHNLTNICYSFFIIMIFSFIIAYLLNIYSAFKNKYSLNLSVNLIKEAIVNEKNTKVGQIITICFYVLIVFYIINASFISTGLKTRQAWKEVIKGYGFSYNEQLMTRYKMIIDSDSDIVYVPVLKNIPKTINSTDIPTINDLNIDMIHQPYVDFFDKKNILSY